MTGNDYKVLKERLAERMDKGGYDPAAWSKFEDEIIGHVDRYLSSYQKVEDGNRLKLREFKEKSRKANKQLEEIKKIQKFLNEKDEEYVLDTDIFIDTRKISVSDDEIEQLGGHAHIYKLWSTLQDNIDILIDGIEKKQRLYTKKAGVRIDLYKRILLLNCMAVLEFLLKEKITITRNEGCKLRSLVNTILDEVDGYNETRDCYSTMKHMEGQYRSTYKMYVKRYSPEILRDQIIKKAQAVELIKTKTVTN